ncbi:MAG: MBL fold metallo-hydrolase [Candidatus Vogelbacteria bacterium]|nr:MBL fold metallo-hydrolase [Candidatus Vogelbacteria bacterium]
MGSEKSRINWAKCAALLFLLLVGVFVWMVALREARGDTLTVSFLDVGQGDAAFIETPHGNQMLIDLGPGTRVLSALGDIMPFYDRSIDMILLTHPDADHVGGLPEALERYEASAIVLSRVDAETTIWQESKQAISREGAEIILIDHPIRITLDEGVIFEIIFPDRDALGFETNTASIVGRLVYGEISFLFTGDSPREIEDFLIAKWGSSLKSDVLKVGHHGSKTSSGGRFLSSVRPDAAIVSVGKDNRYGHPHEEVLAALAAQKIEILRTDSSGTVTFQTDGRSLSRVKN